ncbi:hypothetical protein [Liquorilactobacillus uvarum]|nr:hypothetical protein [Liquorilactobacillus uvarum]
MNQIKAYGKLKTGLCHSNDIPLRSAMNVGERKKKNESIDPEDYRISIA